MSADATRLLRRLGAGLAALVLLLVGWAWWGSRLPASYGADAMGVADFGGGPEGGHHDGHHDGPDAAGVSLTTLTADPTRAADVRYELVARAERVTLPGAMPFDGYTLNGTTPAPEIRAREGQVVEVVLRNENVAAGTTLHWHGLDVPNAMDGVAGVTQDAVLPGESFTYRFVANQVGTFWYHSHQVANPQVVGGLFGALVVEPAAGGEPDAVALLHTYPGQTRSLSGVLGDAHREAPAGSRVRMRVVNTDNLATAVWVAGGPFRLVAVDGVDLHGPTPIEGRRVIVPAGGRVDLAVEVPASGGVRLQAPGVSLVLGPAGASAPTASSPGEILDLLTYGTSTPLPFATDAPDRFSYDIGRLPGFLDGRPGFWWSINGRIVPHVPMFVVAEGDVVVMRITNNSGQSHPMHLHGHHLVVLARNEAAASGSPWWVDSLEVGHGESYDVAFLADNPGIWMDHCHNLPHAAEGLMTHVMYTGVTTPFLLGAASGNVPE